MAPRPSRNDSQLNVYHVLISGNNNEKVFVDDEDKRTFLSILQEKSKAGACEIYAFCILCNKVNFLIKVNGTTLSDLMKQVNVSYAAWFNRKYRRCGHVFRDRYRSVAVNSEEQFTSVKRYIRLNPVIERFVTDPDDYPYSWPKGTDCELAHIFGYYDNCVSNLDAIAAFLVKMYMAEHKLTRDLLKSGQYAVHRIRLVGMVRQSTGFSIRKISQLLDVNRGEVYRIIQIESDSREG